MIAVLIAALLFLTGLLTFAVLLRDDVIEPLDLGPLERHGAFRAAMTRHPSNGGES
jgi:hypothetical protein